MIAKLHRTLQRARLANVEPRLAEAYHLPLPDDSVDLAFMVTSFHPL